MNQIDLNAIVADLVGKNFETILSGLKGAAKNGFAKLQVDFDLAFRRYLSGAYEKYSLVKTLLYRTQPQYLYSFFECNTLALGEREIDASNVDNVLDLSHFLVLEGAGGIGKSTLMKHFFLNELEKKDLIPIYIELKDLNHFVGTLFQFIYFSLSRLGFGLKEEYLEYAMKSGCFLFLFDGFDEVVSSRSDALYGEIDELCDRYPKNWYIISSRPNNNFVSFRRFSVLDALELSKEQALSLIRKLKYDPDTKERFLQQLDETLYDSHESFASNPLLLNMMLLTFENYAEIPARLHVFYANAFETLYSRHDATKSGFRREMKSKLTYHLFKMIFAELCFRTWITEQLEFSEDDLNRMLRAIGERYPELEARAYVDDLIQSVCMLYRDGLLCRFVHRSFQEYFTAYFIREQPDDRQKKILHYILDRAYGRLVYDDVFDMLWDMNPELFERNLIIPLLEELEQEIQPQLDSGADRYRVFLKLLVNVVCFDAYLFDEYEDGFLTLRGNPDHNLSQFVFHITRYYHPDVLPPSVDRVFEQEMVDRQQQNEDFDSVDFTVEEVLADARLFAYIKKSWIGILVRTASDLLETLQEKHRQSTSYLDELLV